MKSWLRALAVIAVAAQSGFAQRLDPAAQLHAKLQSRLNDLEKKQSRQLQEFRKKDVDLRAKIEGLKSQVDEANEIVVMLKKEAVEAFKMAQTEMISRANAEKTISPQLGLHFAADYAAFSRRLAMLSEAAKAGKVDGYFVGSNREVSEIAKTFPNQFRALRDEMDKLMNALKTGVQPSAHSLESTVRQYGNQQVAERIYEADRRAYNEANKFLIKADGWCK